MDGVLDQLAKLERAKIAGVAQRIFEMVAWGVSFYAAIKALSVRTCSLL